MDLASAQDTLRLLQNDKGNGATFDPSAILLNLLRVGKVTKSDLEEACTSNAADNVNDSKKADDNANNEKVSKQEVPRSVPPCSSSQPQQSRYRHVALLFHYDGASYSGFAQNLPPSNSISSSSDAATKANAVAAANDNSIERALFEALTKTCLITSREEANYSRAGRTDRGVSAFGQVVALNLKSAIPLGARLPLANDEGMSDGNDEKYGREVTEDDLPRSSEANDALDCWAPARAKGKNKKGKKKSNTDAEDASTASGVSTLNRRKITELSYCRMLNNVLPPTIRVLGWCPVTPEFSARFSCSDRTYRYHFIRRNLDLPKMEVALQKMVGRHDFRNLCKMNVEQVYNFERVIKSAQIIAPTRDSDDETDQGYHDACYFEIIGQAFLWHQIRCIVSVLFMVGKGLESPDIVDHLFNIQENPGKPAYPMADELPLVLHRCSYGGGNDGVDRVPFRRSVRDLWRVECDIEKRWEEMTLSAARLRNGLESLGAEAMVTREDVNTFVRELLEERNKKSRRAPSIAGGTVLTDQGDDTSQEPDTMIPWGDALSEICSRVGAQPSPEGPKEILHIPLLQRSRGTTYEEKVASLNSSPKGESDDTKKRRRERFEENIVRKRKTTEEDTAFYDHMLSQGAR